MSEVMDTLKNNGQIKGSEQEIGLIVKFTASEIEDLIACAHERGFDELGEMARAAILDDLFK